MLPLKSAVLLLALLTGAFLPADADALIMCAKIKKSTGEIREGTPLRLRGECRPNEVAVDPDALGLQGPPGDPGQPGVDGSDGVDGADGMDGISCWDTDQDLTCDAGEDVAEPFGCGVEDCTDSLGSCGIEPVVHSNVSGDSRCAQTDRSCILRYRVDANSIRYITTCQDTFSSSEDLVICCG